MANPEYNEESKRKAEIMRKIDEIIRMRKPLILAAIFFIVISEFIFKPYPTAYIAYAVLILLSILIFPVIYFIKKKADALSSRTIYLIITGEFVVETLSVFILFYLWVPIITYYMGGGIIFILGLILILWVITDISIFDSKIYSQFFFLLACMFLIIFGLFEYLGLYPVYSSYPVENLYHTGQVTSLTLSLLMVIIMLSIIYSRFQGSWKTLSKQTKDLKELNDVLDIKVNERTHELEEAKNELEKNVEERTKELNEKVEELEKFRKLSIGRELKMIELKKTLQDSDKTIAELNKVIEDLKRKK